MMNLVVDDLKLYGTNPFNDFLSCNKYFLSFKINNKLLIFFRKYTQKSRRFFYHWRYSKKIQKEICNILP